MSDRVVKVRLLAQVSEYEAGMLKAAQATRRTGSEVEKLEQKKQAFEQVGRGLAITGAALAGVTALSVKAAMDWQSAWTGVTKTVDGTPEQMARVEAGLRGLTAVLPASHEEIAAVAEAAGQLGIKTGNVVEFTKTMIDLGETTNLSADEAATSLARFVNIMGTSQSKVANIGSALVGLGNNFATTEAEVMALSMRLAGAGKQVGLTEGDVLGLSAALSSVGIEAEAGGSAMSKVMIEIAAAVEEGGAKLNGFASTAGMSAQDFAKLWKTDAAGALTAFVQGLGSTEKQGKSTLGVLADLGITEQRMRDALLRSSAAAETFTSAMRMGNAEFDKNKALQDEAAKRYATTESKLRIAGNAIRDAAIDFGEVFLPAVGAAADGAAGFAKGIAALPDPVKGIIGILTGAGGAVAFVGGAALLAVPKIAAFKVSMEVLTGTSFSFRGGLMSILRFLGGPWGVGMLAATAAVVSFNKAIEAGTPQQAEIRNAIVTSGEAVDGFKKAFENTGFADTWFGDMKAELSDLPGLFKKVDDGMPDIFQLTASDKGVLDGIHRYGDALSEVAQTDMPKAMASFSALAKAKGWDADLTMRMLKEMSPLYDAYVKMADGSDIATDSSEFMQMVLSGMPPSLEGAEDGLGDVQDAAEEAAQALDTTAQALDDVAGKAMAMGDAKDRAQQALNDMAAAATNAKDATDAEKASLEGTNDASIKLRDSMREVEQSHRDSADAIIQNTGDLKAAQDEWQKGRDAVIKMREAKGEDTATAQAWADQNLGSAGEVKSSLEQVYRAWLDLPENRETKYRVELDEAKAKLADFQRKWGTISGSIIYRAQLPDLNGSASGSGRPGMASGGPVTGPGPKGVDSELRVLAPGEHVLTAADVDALGGQAAVMAMRAGLHSSDPGGRWVPTIPTVAASRGAGGSGASTALPAVYVQNPFTGDYLLAKVATVADGRAAARGERLSADLRGGRRADF